MLVSNSLIKKSLDWVSVTVGRYNKNRRMKIVNVVEVHISKFQLYLASVTESSYHIKMASIESPTQGYLLGQWEMGRESCTDPVRYLGFYWNPWTIRRLRHLVEQFNMVFCLGKTEMKNIQWGISWAQPEWHRAYIYIYISFSRESISQVVKDFHRNRLV